MAKTAKAKGYKLNFKPTPISRLSRMKVPFKMVGDPEWNYHARGATAWESRQKAVYEYEIDRKRNDAGGWTNALYYEAVNKNEWIDHLVVRSWNDFREAELDNIEFDREAAERENAAWDYHHEYCPELA
jgi:hypothetical protein